MRGDVGHSCILCGRRFYRSPTAASSTRWTGYCSRACAAGLSYVDLPPTKTCYACRVEKPIGEFELTVRKVPKRRCKACPPMTRRQSDVLLKYGITLTQLEEMAATQGGACAVCKVALTTPHIDHCHTTGKIRGLLCLTCNAGIGLLRDDPALLRRAVEYLERS